MSLLAHFESRERSEAPRTITVGLPVETVPPPTPVLGTSPAGDADGPGLGATARAVCRTLLSTRTSDGDLRHLEAALEELVVVWTPAVCLRSRSEVVRALADADDALGEVVVVFDSSASTGSSVFVEWVATGRFTGPALLNDDELVEPSGAVIRVGGAMQLSFQDGQHVSEIHCYYDRLGLTEQLIRGSAGW
ncbi:nuclear transport factor 2 family protein [Ilumatobacter nonamiensis]|uniref:nuclear transport factor 2 family protein n=1 Tax=Ilumatobacter nonamiensis TaxID=467093 RepID=UPI00034A5883|nr:ester cyclase [Ilumatobacter nonamiensis]